MSTKKWKPPLIIACIFTILTIADLLYGRSAEWLSFEIIGMIISWLVFFVNMIMNNSVDFGDERKQKKSFGMEYKRASDYFDNNFRRENRPTMAHDTIEIWDKSAFPVGNTAYFNNGQVFCNFKYTEPGLIGYYAVEDDRPGRVTVRDKNKYVIGVIDIRNGNPSLIWLSREGHFKRKRDMGFNSRIMGDMVLLAGEFYNLPKDANGMAYIQDNSTADVLAEYCGDSIGAGAAFICMYYEVSSNGKLHEFYYGQKSY